MNFYRTSISTVGFILASLGSYAQEFMPLKSPDVTAFMTANFLPVSEYTGKVGIEIPLYTINLDGLEIPISISYNTGGININSAASRVGLNWTLHAGGVVSKEVRGYQDTDFSGGYNSETGHYVYGRFGYLMNLFPYSPVTVNGYSVPVVVPYQYSDTQPDIFYVIAPGLETKFAHQSNGNPVELIKTGSIIKSPFQAAPPIDVNTVVSFNITSPKGFVYSFSDNEEGQIFIGYRPDGAEVPNDGNLMDNAWPADVTTAQIQSRLIGYNINPLYAESAQLFTSCNLTTIKNPVTNRMVKYFYKVNRLVDINRRVEGKIKWVEGTGVSDYSQTNYEHDLTYEQIIDKIVFPEGFIDFYYDNNRPDQVGAKRLSKIEVRNNDGQLIKGIVFEHDFFSNSSGCTNPDCLRLKLTGIKFYDKDSQALPGYSFNYNLTQLPKRYSLNQDFSSIYNGDHGLTRKAYVPKNYYKANQQKNSFMPFALPEYQLMGGNASLASNLQYAKAGMLEKITHPTGGSTTLEYELNSFNYLGTDVDGGGLRILSQSIFNDDGILQKKLSYNYNLPNGRTSGTILRLPKSTIDFKIDAGIAPNWTYYTYQDLNTRQELTDGSYVGYSSVKISEQNNGYTINEYSSPSNFPNIYGSENSTYPGNSHTQDAISKGLMPNIFQDMDVKRGKLLSSKVYDNQNILLKSITNEYSYKTYSEFPVYECFRYTGHSQYQDGDNDGYLKFTSKLVSESNDLVKSVVSDFASSSNIVTETGFVYAANGPFLKEKWNNLSTGTDLKKEKYYYPFDTDLSAFQNMNRLIDLNIFTTIKTTYLKNEEIQVTKQTLFGDFGANRILPSAAMEAFGNNLVEMSATFNQYDKRGNLIEYMQKDGLTKSVLWGYNYKYKIAEVVGATYANVLSALSVSDLSSLQFLTDSQLATELDKIRTGLPQAQVYTYSYLPLIGLKTEIDLNGKKSSFNYDSFNRLSSVMDDQGNIVSKYDYNYKLKPAISVPSDALSLEIKTGPVDDYLEIPTTGSTPVKTLFSANVKGGRGDYSYEWTQVGSSTLIGRQSFLEVTIPCGSSFNAQLKVTDSNGTIITQTATSHARLCTEAFFVDNIQILSGGNNWTKNYQLAPAEGGSYKFSYSWSCSPMQGLGFSQWTTFTGGVENQSTISSTTFTLTVTVKDKVTNQTVTKSVTFTVPKQFTTSCFVAGTKIIMSDGSEKNIEDVKVGDKVLTYDIDLKEIEPGDVEVTTNPLNDKMVRLKFENGLVNVNTVDHPYFIKDKGWCSYQPDMTKSKYGLTVKKIEIGDVALLYVSEKEDLKEVKIISLRNENGSVQTYNLNKVSKNHNFFANGILVHNKSSQD
jgi:hypothetical protein